MTMNLSHYKNIIFDLGGVILNLDYHRTFDAFKRFAPQIDDDTFVGKSNQHTIFSDYEIGKISTQDFRASLNSFYKMNLTDDIFDSCWNAMLLDLPWHRIELIQNLKTSGKKVFLLSNINEIHEREVDLRFKSLGFNFHFKELFHKAYYSHEIGLRKPSREVFELVLSENKIEKIETVFIDDSLQHIRGADSLGLKAVHHQASFKLENYFNEFN
jgi:putative hydrolase of the HAD superfamily